MNSKRREARRGAGTLLRCSLTSSQKKPRPLLHSKVRGREKAAAAAPRYSVKYCHLLAEKGRAPPQTRLQSGVKGHGRPGGGQSQGVSHLTHRIRARRPPGRSSCFIFCISFMHASTCVCVCACVFDGEGTPTAGPGRGQRVCVCFVFFERRMRGESIFFLVFLT